MTVLSYSWARNLVTGTMVSVALHAKRGMIAGCVAATRELKAYMADALSSVVIKNPLVDLEAWIDDLNIQAEHEDETVLESITEKATKDLPKKHAR